MLMDSKTVRLYHDHLLVKEPNTEQHTPYHQDQPYYNISGEQIISFWIPVDPVPLESSLEFIAGSHKHGWYEPKTFLTNQAKWFRDGDLPDIPTDIETTNPVLKWALNPGDAVAFHMLTAHGSKGSTDLRRAFSVRYMGDDIRRAPRIWRTSPESEGLSSELPEGVEMDHPLFPLVFP